jgi:signal transduction histidine kinase
VKIPLVWLGLVCAPLVLVDSAFAQGNAQKRVIVFNALRKDAPVPLSIDRDFQKIIGDGLAGGLDYYSESIDVARFSDDDYPMALRQFLARKYHGRRFDLVIAVSEACLTFVENNREALFSDTPIVFLVSPGTRRSANSTGVFIGLDLSGTIALATKLHPDATNIYIVSGASDNDRFYENLARTQSEVFRDKIAFTYLSGLPMTDLEQRLAALPPRSLVYYLLVTQDGAGRNYSPVETLERVAAATNAPLYSFMELWMNHGLVGGSLLSLERPVQLAAEQALRVLRGERADSIPTTEINPNVDQVDWRQLRRWNIDESRVPAGTTIKFREPTTWERYKLYIIGAISVLLIQTMLIAGLLVHRRQRRQAEEGVLKSEAELRSSYARIRDLARRLITAQEAERTRIARDLHDDVGQQLALLSIELEQLGDSVQSARADALKRARDASDRAAGIASSVHDLSHQLHPPKLELIGLVAAIEGLRRELASQHQITIHFSHQGVPAGLPREVALCLFRIAQEGLRNAIRHSAAREVSVELGAGSDGLVLVVADQGAGFDVNANGHAGLGLLSMRERLEPVGGTLTIRSAVGAGTRLEAAVPLERAQATG